MNQKPDNIEAVTDRIESVLRDLYSNPEVVKVADDFVVSVFSDNGGKMRNEPLHEKLKFAYMCGVALGVIISE